MKSVALLALSFWLMAESSFAQRVNRRQQEEKNQPSSRPNLPPTVKKARYRIDVLAGVYLDEAVKNGKSIYANKIPNKTQVGLSFYEGVKLATEKLNEQGYKMDIYFHDIGSADQNVQSLINSYEFQNTDLIIGAVQGNDIKELATFAQAKKINFISAISPSDAGVQGNLFYTILQPTLSTHVEFISGAILKKYPGQSITLLTMPTKSLDKTATQIVLDKYGDKFMKFSASEMNMHPWGKYFDSTRVNPILATMMESADVEKVLLYLKSHYPTYDFDIYGMPTWKFIRSYKKTGTYPNVQINYTTPFYFEANTGAGADLNATYKKTFGTSQPAEMVYSGFETVSWFAYLLHKYGTIFNHAFNDNAAAVFTRYDIKANYDDNRDYLFQENKNLYLFHYRDGNVHVEN